MTRDRCRRYFLEQLSKYIEVDFYWFQGRLISRCPETRRTFAIDEQSVWIGRYRYPFSPEAFLLDMDEAITLIKAPRINRLPLENYNKE